MRGHPFPTTRSNLIARISGGFIGAARILGAAGARQIFSPHAKWCGYEPGRIGSLDTFTQAMDSAGWDSGRLALFSFHIQGTARLGDSPKSSVTNPDGEVWETRNLYALDNSCFPFASGVNPMISIEAIAHQNAASLRGADGLNKSRVCQAAFLLKMQR
jgi:choline dehydrogenase-like flavoprotein